MAHPCYICSADASRWIPDPDDDGRRHHLCDECAAGIEPDIGAARMTAGLLEYAMEWRNDVYGAMSQLEMLLRGLPLMGRGISAEYREQLERVRDTVRDVLRSGAVQVAPSAALVDGRAMERLIVHDFVKGAHALTADDAAEAAGYPSAGAVRAQRKRVLAAK